MPNRPHIDRPLDPTFVRAQVDLLFAQAPEITDDEQLRADMLEGNTNLHEFLDLLVRAIVQAEAFAAGIQLLLLETNARRLRYERRADLMREMARKLIEHAGLKTVELHQATLSIRAGSPKVIITDETMLPDSAVKITRTPAKQLIKTLIDQGVFVPGAELSNAEPVLMMRIK